jgi:Flp pilus assembly pilin Flp
VRKDIRVSGAGHDVRAATPGFDLTGNGAMDINALKARLRRLASSDAGQDLVEYALLASLIAIVAIGAVTEVGNTINTVFWGAIAAANV